MKVYEKPDSAYIDLNKMLQYTKGNIMRAYSTLRSLCDEPWIPQQQERFLDCSGHEFWELVNAQFHELFRI